MTDGGYGGQQDPASLYPASQNAASPYPAISQPSGLYSDPSQAPAEDGGDRNAAFGNGVSLQPSYNARDAKSDVDLGLYVMKTPGHDLEAIRTLRIEIEPFAVNYAPRWISDAISNGYDVIATYHNEIAINPARKPSDDAQFMQECIDFWVDNYAALRAGGPFTINIMNEFGHQSISSNNYAEYYNQAISAIRKFYSGPLIIDLPGWGQVTRTAIDAVTGKNGTRIADPDIILSAHVYPEADNAGQDMKPADLIKMDAVAKAAGISCMIGEFGESGKDRGLDQTGKPKPKTDWVAVVTQAKSLGWPILAWAWAGDGTKPSPMNIMSPGIFAKFNPQKQNAYGIAPYAGVVVPLLK